jgi:hypothetical protein
VEKSLEARPFRPAFLRLITPRAPTTHDFNEKKRQTVSAVELHLVQERRR